MHQKYAHLFIIRDNIIKQQEFICLNKAFKANDTPMAPIKGMALLYEINNYAETRPMADIDILVKKEDIDRSKNILLNLGYKIKVGCFSEDYYLNHYHHLPFYNKHMVELHWFLSPPRPNKILLPELWKRVRQVKCGEDNITILSPEDTIFSLALHLRRFNDPFSLRYIRDIYKILEIHSSKLDWRYISKYSRLNRLNSLFYYALISVKINMEYPVPNNIINMFYPGISRATLLKFFIAKKLRRLPSLDFDRDRSTTSEIGMIASNKKYFYVFLRFLLYDHLWDFMKFIILLPEEEFSRFYFIKFPSKISSTIYSFRFFFIPLLFFNLKSSRKSSM